MPSESEDSNSRPLPGDCVFNRITQNRENTGPLALRRNRNSLTDIQHSNGSLVINSNQFDKDISYTVKTNLRPIGYLNSGHLCSIISLIQLMAVPAHHFPEEWGKSVESANGLLQSVDNDINHTKVSYLSCLINLQKKLGFSFTKDECLFDVLKKILSTIKEDEHAKKLFALDMSVECINGHKFEYPDIWIIRSDKRCPGKWCYVKDCDALTVFDIKEDVKIMFVMLDPVIHVGSTRSFKHLYQCMPSEVTTRYKICGVCLYEERTRDPTIHRHFTCIREDFRDCGILWYCDDKNVSKWESMITPANCKLYYHTLVLCKRIP